jgi:hypothetical protein
MTRSTRLSLIAVLGAAALVAVTAAPAQAQEIPDVPPLGFQIDPAEGAVGSTVNGQVDVDDVAANCITDPTEFVGQFVDPAAPLDGGTPYIDAVLEVVNALPPETDLQNDPLAFAAVVALFFPVGLAQDLPANGGTGELVDGALEQTFVMSFADIATASPIEPRGNFDPTTGVGEVTVPDLAPGSHPVISTCVALPAEITQEQLTAAIDAGTAFVESNLTAPYPIDVLGEPPTQFAEAAGQIAPVILEALVEPQALGIQFFCVTDASGACPGTQPPPTTPTPPPAAPTAPPATPITGIEPNFTG